MKKNIVKIIILLMIAFVCFGCGEKPKQKATHIKLQNAEDIVVNLGEGFQFENIKVEVIFTNGNVLNEPLSGKYINVLDLFSKMQSIGDKEITVSYTDEVGNTLTTILKFKVVEEEYKLTLKDELQKYKATVIYSDVNYKKVLGIKMTAYANINSASSEQEALVFAEYAKRLIDEVYSQSEENLIYTAEEVFQKISKLEKDLSSFVNYEDSAIKTEIEAMKSRLQSLEGINVEEEITTIKNVVSALSSNFNGVKQKVLNHSTAISELTGLMNNELVKYITKEQVELLNDTLKRELTEAIDLMALEVIEEVESIEILVEDNVLKWKKASSNSYIELVDLDLYKNASITDAGLNTEGHLIIELSNGTEIDAGLVYDATANEGIKDLTSKVEELESEVLSFKAQVEELQFATMDALDKIALMDQYFADMGFDFEEGSSADLMTAIITLLPAQLEQMGIEFDFDNLDTYMGDFKSMKANYDKLLSMMNAFQTITNDMINVSTEEGSLLSKESKLLDALCNVSVLLQSFGISENDANKFQEFLASLREAKKLDVVKRYNDYFETLYSNNKYDITQEELLSEYLEDIEDYCLITSYDSLNKVRELKLEISKILQNEEFIEDSENIKKLLDIEVQLSKIDSNLEIVKAYFSSKLELSNLDNNLVINFKNRILCTNSIENVISLYNLALGN